MSIPVSVSFGASLPVSPTGQIGRVRVAMFAPPLSRRAAAKALGLDRGTTLEAMIRSGVLGLVPWGRSWRIPAEDVARVAREGWRAPGAPRRPGGRPRRRGGASGARELLAMNLEDLWRA